MSPHVAQQITSDACFRSCTLDLLTLLLSQVSSFVEQLRFEVSPYWERISLMLPPNNNVRCFPSFGGGTLISALLHQYGAFGDPLSKMASFTIFS